MQVRPVAIGVVALAIALLLWAWFAGEPPAGEVRGAPPVSTTEPATPASGAIERSEAAVPQPVEAGKEATGAPAGTSVRVPAWLARFLVVDQDDQPVASAVVTLWAGRLTVSDPKMDKLMGGKGYSYSGREKQPLLELHTDIQGRAQAQLEIECVVAAARKGEQSTGEHWIWNVKAERETKLVLEQPLVLRGIVLHEDGRPASGARVTAEVSGGSILQRGQASPPEPVSSGPDGRFELPVREHAVYRLQARLDGKATLTESPKIRPPLPEVVLRFPGGITLKGIVVDPAGKPVPTAEVSSWREIGAANPMADLEDPERGYVKAGDDGRFSIPVRRYARYQLVAECDEHANSKATWVETSPERPHAEVRLQLLEPAAIKGRVVHGDGRPFPGVTVDAAAEAAASRGSAEPGPDHLFGSVKGVKTGDDGGFVLVAHPAVTWTVRARPDTRNHQLAFTQTGVAPGRDAIELRIGDRQLGGCTVHGTVTRAGGQPVGPYVVQVFPWEGDKPAEGGGGDARARIEGSAFTLPALPPGRWFALLVTPMPEGPRGPRHDVLAPAHTAPFLTDRAEMALEIRLEELARLNVQVLTAKGLPARGVYVTMLRVPQVGSPIGGGPVDADGRNAVRCAPGQSRLLVMAQREQLAELELMLKSGLNPDVVVRLPAGR